MPASAVPDVRAGRALLAGAACLALPVLLHAALLPVLGEGTPLLFVVFLLSLLPGVGTVFVHAGGGLTRVGFGMCLMVGTAFVSLALHEARIFGPVPSVAPADAPSRPAAAGFHLPGAAPRVDRQRQVAVSITVPSRDMRGRSAGSAQRRGRFTVVPVVDAGWTPAQPVSVVAVVDHAPGGGPAPEASWGYGSGVLRLLPDPLRERAVAQALAEANLVAAPGIVVGRWVSDPGWARIGAALPLIWLLGLAFLGWAVLVVTDHPALRARFAGAEAAPAADPDAGLAAGPMVARGIGAMLPPCLLALALRQAGIGPGVMMMVLGFAAVPALMTVLPGFGRAPPVGAIICGVILVVSAPFAVALRGARPDGTLPSLDGARWADVQEGLLVLGAACLAWTILALATVWLEGRARRATPR